MSDVARKSLPASKFQKPMIAILLKKSFALSSLIGGPMRLILSLAIIIIVVQHVSAPSYAEGADADLRIYAVNIVRTPPQSKEPFVNSAIYLGRGLVITAAHVVGPNLRVQISGQDLPAAVIKQGSYETTDLALLSVNQTELPVGLLLRRNPLCKAPPMAGESVVIVVRGRTAHSRIISRDGLNTFIVPTDGDSGSGVFRVEKSCLLGILNYKVWDYYYLLENGHLVRDLGKGSVELAKHFVPASTIIDFIPSELRF